MKKICILSTVNLKHMTILSLYTNYLEKNNIPYDIIYIDKYQEPEKINAKNKYAYQLYIEREWPLIKKLIRYVGFRKYAKEIIRNEHYDFIIVWNSFTALMFSGFLTREFKGSYCLNVRDYFYEKNRLIYSISKKLINYSSFTTISSDGFKSFLPSSKYITIHSFNKNVLKNCFIRDSIQQEGKKIRISFIGYVRFFESDKRLIDALGNDKRFIIQFFGEGSQVLKKYAEEKGYGNVICKGRFEPQETAEFLNKTDIINNLYGNGRVELDTAISIKTYYAAYLNIPIMVFEDTYMEEVTRGFNFVSNLKSDNLAEELYNWYKNIDFEDLKKSCRNFLKTAEESNTHFYKVMSNHLDGEK